MNYSDLYTQEQLEGMYEAACTVSEIMRVLHKSDTNIVGEILKTSETFYEWEHIPPQDVYDTTSHCQYYYHAHAKSEDGSNLHDDEHGHFHTFIRGRAMPESIKPAPLDDFDPAMPVGDINTHVIGIGMDQAGVPMRLFTVNRWVTGETWHKGEDIIAMLEHYEIDDVRPSWPMNLWVTNMIALYRPQIEDLVTKRDAQIKDWQGEHGADNVFENRDLEVASYLNINLSDHIERIEHALGL